MVDIFFWLYKYRWSRIIKFSYIIVYLCQDIATTLEILYLLCCTQRAYRFLFLVLSSAQKKIGQSIGMSFTPPIFPTEVNKIWNILFYLKQLKYSSFLEDVQKDLVQEVDSGTIGNAELPVQRETHFEKFKAVSIRQNIRKIKPLWFTIFLLWKKFIVDENLSKQCTLIMLLRKTSVRCWNIEKFDMCWKLK